jgi:hypothetical protein
MARIAYTLLLAKTRYALQRLVSRRFATLRFALQRLATPCYDSLRYASLHFATLCNDSLRFDSLRYATLRSALHDSLRQLLCRRRALAHLDPQEQQHLLLEDHL